MSKRFDFGGVNLRADDEKGEARPSSETPFCIALLGDFSGRSNRGIVERQTVGERRPYSIDRDNFDEVLSKLHPELHLASEGGGSFVFRFSELDDFHPDHLVRTEAFQKLKNLRERAQDPSTFKEVAQQLGMPALSASGAAGDNVRVTPPDPVRLAAGSLLDDMIERTESRITVESHQTVNDVHEFARQLSAKYAVSAPDARQPEVVASVDRAMSDSMRAVLHHPDFQALEALWRGTFLLVRELETGPRLKIFLIDISKRELAADLMGSDHLENSEVFRLLVEKTNETLGAAPFTIVVGAFRFGSASEDLDLLPKLAKIAHRGGAVLLAGADPKLLGCSSLAETPSPRDWKQSELQSSWEQVRCLPESSSVGLALPNLLLRLPYGKETARTDSFDFEEFDGAPKHDEYLWGNPAFVVALMIGQDFEESGWEMRPGSRSQLGNLPLHTYRVEGQSQSKPCAEVLLTEDGVERILDQGLIPLVSYKGRDAVRVARFQSIAKPHGALRGKWALEDRVVSGGMSQT